MKRTQQAGFTLIELVVVIVILGILAATAIPRFVDLSDEAGAAAAQGYAGALSSASSVNRAACLAGSSECQAVATCGEVGGLVSPAITFASPVADPTVRGTLYMADTTVALTATGTPCSFVYGDGSTGGVTTSFTGYLAN